MINIFSVLLLVFHTPVVASSDAPVVRILEGAQVPSDSAIYFKDVAVFDDFPSEFKNEVENIKVAENDAEYSKMTSQELLSQVRPVIKRIERECQCKINLTLPRSLQNHTMQGQFSLEKLTAKVNTILKNHCPECQYHMAPLKISQGEIPATYTSWELDSSIKNLRGNGLISVYFDQKALDPLIVSTQVGVSKPALRLRKHQTQGAQLDPSQLEVVMTDTTFESRKLAKFENLQNQELQRSMRNGQIVYMDDLTEMHLVRLGQPLSIDVTHGAFHIKLSGVAQRSGRMGEKIPVRINKTRKDIVAEVTAEGRVRMDR